MPAGSWAPSCGVEVLKARAMLYARIRQFFDLRGVMEVSTPVLTQEGASDVYIESFHTDFLDSIRASKRYLQTSPEYLMKRLLAAGAGPIYQIAPCFRRSESGRRHNPEFTMLEWYRPRFGLQQLIDELIDLLRICLPSEFSLSKVSYADLFGQALGLNPHTASLQSLQLAAERLGLHDAQHVCGRDRSQWLDYLFSEVIQPQMKPNTVYCVDDYPACQAMLAQLKPTEPPVAERFEIFMDGMELANGFHELTDSQEQARRFEADQAQRSRLGLPEMPFPLHLIDALEQGLPDTSGVALGLDRLLMIACGKDHINQVLSFPFDRA